MTCKKQLEGGSGGRGSANFQPISSTMKRNGKGGEIYRKGPWTPEEDALLMQYVKRYGERHWNSVQKTGLMRCGKSCRLRWTNHLRPDLKKGAFTVEEERAVINLHDKLGNKWSKIAAQLPGRTDNEVKNFWNTKIKRKMRADSSLSLLDNNHPSHLLQDQQQQQSQQTNVEPLSQLQFVIDPINHSPIEPTFNNHYLISPSNNSNSNPNPDSNTFPSSSSSLSLNSTQDPIISFLDNPAYNNLLLKDQDIHHHNRTQQNGSVLSDFFQFPTSSGVSRFHFSPATSPTSNYYFNPTPSFLTTSTTPNSIQFDYGSSNYDPNLFQPDSSRPHLMMMETKFMELPSFQNDSVITTTMAATTMVTHCSPLLPNPSTSSGYGFSNDQLGGKDLCWNNSTTTGMMMTGGEIPTFLQGDGFTEVSRDRKFEGIHDLDYGSGRSGATAVVGDQGTSETMFKKDQVVEAMDDDELRNLLDTFSIFEPSTHDWSHGGGQIMGDSVLVENIHHGDFDVANVAHNVAGVVAIPSSTITADHHHHHLQRNLPDNCCWNNMPGMI